MERKVLLQATGVEKAFGSNKVLNSVDLEVLEGEVMALLGENGAGKSTMVKIITGVYQRDGGEIVFNAQRFPVAYDKDFAEKCGITIIYQELSTIPTLTVAQNIFLGHEPVNKLGLIDYKKMNADVRSLIEKYGFDLDASAYIGDLSIAKRQLVEILKALAFDCRMIIMDEPTASLSEKEVKQLFEIIGTLKARGISILYISHRLKEVYQIADRVTILRDGLQVALLEKNEIEPDKIVHLMIGRKLDKSNYDESCMRHKSGEPLLEVKNLCTAGKFEDISFTLVKGEILGIAGLVGAGRTELMRALFGVDPISSGEIRLNGKPYHPSVPGAIGQGFAFVPEDRQKQGFVPEIELARNIGLTNLDKLKDVLGINRKKELSLAKYMIEKIGILPGNPHYRVIDMSGGNQQKVVLGKWLARDLTVLIADEPTAGVDVGAKEDIYAILRELCESGVSVLLVSSDLPEIVRLSDRILAMHKGRFIKEFAEGYITEEDVLKAVSGFVDDGEVAAL